MRYFREIMSRSAAFIKEHGLIEDETGIMVGLSGGKDSMTLLMVLKTFLRQSKYKYPLAVGYIDLGFGADYSNLQTFCDELEVPLFVEKTDIGAVVFDIRKEKNPCSLCAKMRRGAVNDLAKRNGFSKVALGHNREDYVETYLMNLFYAGKAATFKPLTYLDRKDVTVIRPLLSVPEDLLRRHADNVSLPVLKNPCPADGSTTREDMRLLLKQIEELNERSIELAFRGLERLDLNERRGDQ
ncbi:MAG: tRNA 2-thiocytidine biosynthesis protein TtcA [Firmicutes bacterium]|nr:tRNA 2-thiocytidine biosynthesis protein TtcA [Bacillota bacterium]